MIGSRDPCYNSKRKHDKNKILTLCFQSFVKILEQKYKKFNYGQIIKSFLQNF